MNLILILAPVLGSHLADATSYFKPPGNSVPFMVYFKTHERPICMGAMVSQQLVLTAAACVLPRVIKNGILDSIVTKHISVTVGTKYRHPRRGIKIQVTKILYPKNLGYLSEPESAFRIETSVALLLLRRKVSDVFTEVPVRSIYMDYRGEVQMFPHSTCLTAGWQYFGPGDEVTTPGRQFRVYRYLRVQMMDVVKTGSIFCDTLVQVFQLHMTLAQYGGDIFEDDMICVRDPDRLAQPCHGMLGSPLICGGKLVAVYTSPSAQWTNCTGFTNIYHLVSNPYMAPFMECISPLLEPMMMVNMERIHKHYEDQLLPTYDYQIYDTYDMVSTRDPESDLEEDSEEMMLEMVTAAMITAPPAPSLIPSPDSPEHEH